MSVTRRSFVLGSAAFATIGIITPASAAGFDMKYGLDLPQEHPVNVRSVEAFARIKKATNGRVQIKSFPASVLGSDPSMISQLNAMSPIAAIENLAFAFPNRETARSRGAQSKNTPTRSDKRRVDR